MFSFIDKIPFKPFALVLSVIAHSFLIYFFIGLVLLGTSLPVNLLCTVWIEGHSDVCSDDANSVLIAEDVQVAWWVAVDLWMRPVTSFLFSYHNFSFCRYCQIVISGGDTEAYLTSVRISNKHPVSSSAISNKVATLFKSIERSHDITQ
jgi:hypothetical protein